MTCTFDPNGKLCECKVHPRYEEFKQGCVYWKREDEPCGPCKPGWYCSREKGHDGPHAAWPVSHDTAPHWWVRAEPEPDDRTVGGLFACGFIVGVIIGAVVTGWTLSLL